MFKRIISLTFVCKISIMGNWSVQQELKKEVKEKEKTSPETLGKFFYDLAKTSFTAMVAGGAVSFFTNSDNEDYWILLSIGAFSTMVFAYLGYKIIRR